MSLSELHSLLPLLIPAGMSLIILLLGATPMKSVWLFRLTLLALAGGAIALYSQTGGAPHTIGQFVVFDSLSRLFCGLLYGATFFVLLFARQTIIDENEPGEIFCTILLLALTGMAVVATATHLAAFFLGLEIYTVGLYILIGYRRNRSIGLEAAVKYFILGAISSGFILFGIALLYLELGQLELTALATRLVDPVYPINPTMWLTGTAFLFVGVGFKLSLAPFHMWAPDVYQGAPTPITTWIATGSKTAVVAFLLRYLSLSANGPNFLHIVEIIVIASLLIGNLLALYQNNLKRLLAYSSIAHLGYTLVPVCIGGTAGWAAAIFYLITYIITVTAAFGLLLITGGEDANDLDHYRGLAERAPGRAAALALTFFSLAGIPLTAGFIGKWSIFQVALNGGHYLLAGAVILGASLGAFYYLRVVAQLYFREPESSDAPPAFTSPLLLGAIGLVLIAIVAIGLYPEPLMNYIAEVAGTLQAPSTPLVIFSQQ